MNESKLLMINIYGDKRIGKTTLINRIKMLYSEDIYIHSILYGEYIESDKKVIIVDNCENNSDYTRLFESINKYKIAIFFSIEPLNYIFDFTLKIDSVSGD